MQTVNKSLTAQRLFSRAMIGSEWGSTLSNLDSTLFVHLHNFTQVLCPPSPLRLPVCSWSHSPHQASHNFTVTQLFTSLLAGNHGELTSRPRNCPMAMSCSIQLFVFIVDLDLSMWNYTHTLPQQGDLGGETWQTEKDERLRQKQIQRQEKHKI